MLGVRRMGGSFAYHFSGTGTTVAATVGIL